MDTNSIRRFENISSTMVWKQSALNQIQEFEALAERLGSRLEVVGSHRSKSIELPVVRFSIDGRHFYLRDNFHDVNLCVLTVDPVNVPLRKMFEGVYEPLTWEWYLNQIDRCRNYSWREWSDAQMDHPEILSLTPDAPSFMRKSQKEKDAWIKRMTDPSWFHTNWSSGEICWDEDFGPGTTMWVQRLPFMEGIKDWVPSRANRRYEPGRSAFSLAVCGFNEAELIIRRVCESRGCQP